MNMLRDFRNFMNGNIDESALIEAVNNDKEEDEDISEYENDEEFMQECTAACLPTMIQMLMMDEDAADTMDESVQDAFITVQNYLIGQGVLTEAVAAPTFPGGKNPKVTYVRMSVKAQIARLTSIITLKMARKDNNKNYRKYKIGQKIKKENMAEMRKRYGAKAQRLAKKLWAKTRKNAKVSAVVSDTKKKSAPKKKK